MTKIVYSWLSKVYASLTQSIHARLIHNAPENQILMKAWDSKTVILLVCELQR